MPTEEELARHALKNIAIMMVVKWGIIIGVTQALKKAAEKASKT